MLTTTNEYTLQRLNDALVANDTKRFLVTLGEFVRLKGMSRVAESAGLNRENLYRMLSTGGNPTLSNLCALLRGIGLTVQVNSRKLLRENRMKDEQAFQARDGDNRKEARVGANVRTPSTGRKPFTAALEASLAKRVRHYARKQGVSTETLVNIWLSEKLSEVAH